jgi:hypothetical protein
VYPASLATRIKAERLGELPDRDAGAAASPAFQHTRQEGCN